MCRFRASFDRQQSSAAMRSGNPQSYSAAKSRKPSQPSTAHAAAAAHAPAAPVVPRSQRGTPGRTSSSSSIASSGSYGSLRNPSSSPEWHLRHVTALLLVAGALACFTSVWLLMKVVSRADSSTGLTGLSIRALHVVEQAKPHVMLTSLKEVRCCARWGTMGTHVLVRQLPFSSARDG